MRLTAFVLALGAASFGCTATTDGVHATDLNIVAHEAAAQRDDRLANEELAGYEPDAAATPPECRAWGTVEQGYSEFWDPDVCFTPSWNPTDRHLLRAEELRRDAAAHRAAADRLAAAAEQACVGVPSAERDGDPVARSGAIQFVAPLTAPAPGAPPNPAPKVDGVVVTLQPSPGQNAATVQRAIACREARAEAYGPAVTPPTSCPLVRAGTQTRVSTTNDGLAVRILSDDPVVARQLLACAKLRVEKPAAPSSAAP